MNPPYATKDDVPSEDVEKEREFLTSQVADSGKPADIVQKMVDGRLNKWFSESCLVSQQYVKTNDRTVGKLLEENGAKMIGFTRIAVGEGIEKKEGAYLSWCLAHTPCRPIFIFLLTQSSEMISRIDNFAEEVVSRFHDSFCSQLLSVLTSNSFLQGCHGCRKVNECRVV